MKERCKVGGAGVERGQWVGGKEGEVGGDVSSAPCPPLRSPGRSGVLSKHVPRSKRKQVMFSLVWIEW